MDRWGYAFEGYILFLAPSSYPSYLFTLIWIVSTICSHHHDTLPHLQPSILTSPGLEPWAKKPSFLLRHFSQSFVIATDSQSVSSLLEMRQPGCVCPSDCLPWQTQIASTAWCQGWTTKSLSLYISWETQESTARSERLQNFPQTSVLLTSAVNFTHPRVHPRRKSELRDYPYHIGLCVCLQGNDFIAQSTVGSTIPWASGPSLYKKDS